MAQDLHDGVGHGLAVIAMQAGVGLHVLDRDPAAARTALEAIRDSARESLDALRAELAPRSRASRVGAATAPRPGPADLDALVGPGPHRRPGGRGRPAPPGELAEPVGAVVYGVVQEALTNVLRHASATAVQVRLERSPERMAVTVEDDGRGDRHAWPTATRGWGCAACGSGSGPSAATSPLDRVPRAASRCGRCCRCERRDPITVAVVDDQELVRMGLRTLIGSEAGLELVGEAADGRAGLRLIRGTRPRVVLCDIRMPDVDGLDLLRRGHRRRLPRRGAGGHADHLRARRVRLRGAAARRQRLPAEGRRPRSLLDAVRVVADGGSLLAPSVTRRVIEQFGTTAGRRTPHPQLDQLTEREREVVAWVATRPVQPGDRRAPRGQPGHRAHPRVAGDGEAARARPGPAGGLRDGVGAHPAGQG